MRKHKVNFLDDRLIFDCGKLSRIYGEPDGSSRTEVLYAEIPNLPVDDGAPSDTEETFPIRVPKVGRTIVFYLTSTAERWGHPLDEDLHGPYLRQD